MTEASKTAAKAPQNLTMTTSEEDRDVLSDLERLTGGSSKTEITKRAWRLLQTHLLREEAERARLRAEAAGEA